MYAASTILLVAIGAALKWAFDWLSKLEAEHSIAQHSGLLEDPVSTKKVKAPSLYDPATKSLSIIVPAYNEGDRLRPTLEEALAYLTKRRDKEGRLFTSEIIIVDDGSRDNTTQVAFEFVRKHGLDLVRVLPIPANKGKGHAVKAGMLIARGANLLFMDADGATKVSDVEKLERSLAESIGSGSEKLGMAVGSRAHLESEAIAQRHWFRNFLMRGFHLLVVMVAGSRVRDTQCGFKLVYLATKAKVHVTEVSVNWTEIAGLPRPWHCSPLAYLHAGMSKSNLAAALDTPVDGDHLRGYFDCLLAGGST